MKKTLQTLLAKKPAKNAESNLLCIWSVAIKIRLCNPHIMGIGIYFDCSIADLKMWACRNL